MRKGAGLRTMASLVLLVVAGCGSDDASRPDQSGPRVTATPDAHASGAAAELPEPRTEVGGTAWRGLVAVAGGFTADGGASARFDLYDPQANRWVPGPPLPVALHHLAMATLGDRVYVAGGYTIATG